jgi:hypothetical protein
MSICLRGRNPQRQSRLREMSENQSLQGNLIAFMLNAKTLSRKYILSVAGVMYLPRIYS